MQNAEAVLAVLKSLESPVHPKVPAGFGGRLRGKGPQQRDLAAQPILLVLELAQHGRGVSLVDDQEAVEEFAADRADEAFGDRVGPWCLRLHTPVSRVLLFVVLAGPAAI